LNWKRLKKIWEDDTKINQISVTEDHHVAETVYSDQIPVMRIAEKNLANWLA
jgi:hypothetical protein